MSKANYIFASPLGLLECDAVNNKPKCLNVALCAGKKQYFAGNWIVIAKIL